MEKKSGERRINEKGERKMDKKNWNKRKKIRKIIINKS